VTRSNMVISSHPNHQEQIHPQDKHVPHYAECCIWLHH
jgi:hypothetical protein